MTGNSEFQQGIHRILAILEPGAVKQPALVRSICLARHFQCPVEVFFGIYDQYLAGERFADSEGLRQARAALMASARDWSARILEGMDLDGLEVSVHVGWGSPLAETILSRAREIGAGLIVKEAHYHPRLERALFNNTDWKLLRGFEHALWLVKPGRWAEHPVILAGVDPSQEHGKPGKLDSRILDLSSAVAGVLGGRLEIVHAYPQISNSVLTITAIPGGAGIPLDVSGEIVEEEHRQGLSELLADRDIGRAGVHFVPGNPRDVLLERSKALSANLVVMGAVARGPVKRMLLGSTAEQVLDALRCDILAVRVD
jgi:universal stress protein E